VAINCRVLTNRDILPNLYGPLWPHHSDQFIHAASLRGVNVFLFVT